MMRRYILMVACAIFMAQATLFAAKQEKIIEVNSLEEMLPYFKESGVNVKLKKGEYTITAEQVKSGVYNTFAEVTQGKPTLALFLVAGDGSTYDFSGSVINVETLAYDVHSCDSYPIHFIGSENVVKNLAQIDCGEADHRHNGGVVNMVIDGRENRAEGITIRSCGSTPFGYGELFGKGRVNVMSHRKHSCVLVRGDSNHVLNCNIFSGTYGHCLFMQGADRPVIEGCYIEAKVTTTGAVYSEKGSGSRADKVDFMTYFGFKLDDSVNYTISLAEEGIRAYEGGSTMVDGVRYSRGTSNPTVINNYVKNARGGVTLTHATGKKYVAGCTTVGCGRGFAVGAGGVIENCKADAQYGPSFGVDYDRDNNMKVDIEIIDGADPSAIIINGVEYQTCNGTAHLATIQGENNEIKFRDGRMRERAQEIVIAPAGVDYHVEGVTRARFELGGDNRYIGSLWRKESDGVAPRTLNDNESPLTSSKVANQTDWLIYVDSNCRDNAIYTNGSVEIEAAASGNTIYTSLPECSVKIIGEGECDVKIICTEWDIDTVF